MFDFKSFTENLSATLNALTPKATVPFATAGWLLLYIDMSGWMLLPPTVVTSALVVAVLCTCLVGMSVLTSGWSATQAVRGRLALWVARRRDAKRVERELEFLLPKERQIIACLLANKQKMIEVLPDGEEATTLIAKGFLVLPARRPIAIHRDICVEVPDHVWDVLKRHEDRFPYDQSSDPPNPWRTHWMAR